MASGALTVVFCAFDMYQMAEPYFFNEMKMFIPALPLKLIVCVFLLQYYLTSLMYFYSSYRVFLSVLHVPTFVAISQMKIV